ncbi:hypothetical protein M3J09_001193 [Ascochyta lentis]
MQFLHSLYRALTFWRADPPSEPPLQPPDPAFSKFIFYQNMTPNESMSSFGRPSWESGRVGGG